MTIFHFSQSLRFAITPIRSLIQQQQPRILFSSASVTSPSSQNTVSSIALQQSDEPDKLYKRLEIELKGIDPAVMKSYAWFAATTAQHLGIEAGKS